MPRYFERKKRKRMLISSTDHNDHLLKIQFQVSLHWNEVKDSILKEYYTKQKRN